MSSININFLSLMDLESLLPWLLVIGGILGFLFVFKVLRKAMSLAIAVLVLGIVAATLYLIFGRGAISL